MSEGSIWKKDIGFRKKPAPSTPQPPAAVKPGDRPASIWKRELRLRKPFELAPASAPLENPEQPSPAVGAEEAPGRFGPAPSWESPEPIVLFETAEAPSLETQAELDAEPVHE